MDEPGRVTRLLRDPCVGRKGEQLTPRPTALVPYRDLTLVELRRAERYGRTHATAWTGAELRGSDAR